MKIKETVFLMLIMSAAVLAVSAAYAASLTMSSSVVMALGGTGQVTVYCGVSTCTITKFAWSISSPPSAAPTISGAVLTMTLSGTSANSYTVYVTVFGTGSTVLTSGSATATGGSTSVTVSLSGNVSPQAVQSVEVDVVQTA